MDAFVTENHGFCQDDPLSLSSAVRWTIYTPKCAEQPVCENCKKAIATIWETVVKNSEERGLHLCAECAGKVETPAPKTVFSEKCYYCGSPAMVGFACTPRETRVRGVDFLWKCKRCAEISREVTAQVMEEFKARSSLQLDPEEFVREIDRRIREKRKSDS
jgi:protein-arginine kinase activator protein McsA